MNELISVILPVYNGEKYLDEAIESILNQTYTNFEFIIINDGSKDDSLEIIRKYEQQDSRIIVISRENKGLIATLNEGIGKAKGKYIARMDQDDISLPQRFEKQLKYMIENNLDICGGNFYIIDESGYIKGESDVSNTQEEIFITMVSNVPFAHPSVMMKKDYLINNKLRYGINGYRQAEDLDLWINMFNMGANFGNLSDIVIKYRIVSSSMTRTNYKKIRNEADGQFDKFLNQHINSYKLIFEETIRCRRSIQINIVKAVWRYFLLKKDLIVLYKVLKKIEVINIIRGTLSFIKLKLF